MKKKFLLYASQNYAFAILRPLQAAIKNRGDDVYWYLKGSDINPQYLTSDEQRLMSISEVIAYQADAVFVPGNLVPDFIPGIKVQVFHGFNVEKRSNSRGHFNIRGCFDLCCTQGPNTTGPFQALAEQLQFFTVKETGWPAIDNLYQTDQSGEVKLAAKPTILLCSTFSKSLSCAEEIFNTVSQLSQSGKWHWLVQFHPKMANETVEKYKSIQNEHLQFIETDNVIPLLQQADVMLCDTSSVISMFLLLGKPVVTYKNSSPKPYFIDISDVKLIEQSLEKALARPADLMSAVDDFIKATHPYQDGGSSTRVLAAVDEVLSGKSVALKRKPLNLWRNLKARKGLKYWKFV